MNDMGFISNIVLGGTIPISVVCRNASDVPTTPDADPTFTVYDSAGTSVTTGTLSLNPGSETGFYLSGQVASTGNGFATENVYTVLIEYALSASPRSVSSTFYVK